MLGTFPGGNQIKANLSTGKLELGLNLAMKIHFLNQHQSQCPIFVILNMLNVVEINYLQPSKKNSNPLYTPLIVAGHLFLSIQKNNENCQFFSHIECLSLFFDH